MKKTICFLLCIFLSIGLCACGGEIALEKTYEVESELYSQKDISSAIDTIKSEFRKNWSGCTLTEIYYAGDEYSENHKDWAERNNADEVIVLLSSFKVDSSGGDGSLNPDSAYKNWSWILVRNKNGNWKHVDHGY